MKKKNKLIVSYYSDDNNNLDAVYSVTYPEEVDINFEIETAYDELLNQDEPTNELSEILEYLIGNGLDITYDTLEFEFFNCDYGNFKKE